MNSNLIRAVVESTGIVCVKRGFVLVKVLLLKSGKRVSVYV